MKHVTSAILLSLLCSNTFAADAPLDVAAIKDGDRVSYTYRKYSQETPQTTPALEEKASSSAYTIESGAGEERIFRFKSGVADVYGKDFALIATINREGARKDIAPDTVRHWMPRTELKAGMKWSFENHYEIVASNTTKMCQFFGEFDAVSSASEHELKINGIAVRLPVIVVETRGKYDVQGCQGGTSVLQERYVYSKDLNLVLEQSYLRQDPFGKLFGSNNHLRTVTAISTDKKVAALTPAP